LKPVTKGTILGFVLFPYKFGISSVGSLEVGVASQVYKRIASVFLLSQLLKQLLAPELTKEDHFVIY